MKFRRLVCLALVFICFSPALVHAKTYKVLDIYNGVINTDEIVFKAGDSISAGGGISFEIYYEDANGVELDKGKGKIKSITIDGSKCSEWKMDGYSSSVIQIGSMVRGAFAFTMKPLVAFADEEGYFVISPATYGSYVKDAEQSLGKKVKLTAAIDSMSDNTYFLSVDESSIVAVEPIAETTGDNLQVGDRVVCKGEITNYILHNGAKVPTLKASDLKKQEYEPLQKDDRGANVLQLKERLQTLGYFKASASLSDVYNDVCAERVGMFQENNGLPVTGIADAETLAILYSDAAKGK